MTRIVAYQVQQDGNWDPVAFKKTDLRFKQVFILVNDERKELWIWIGEGADVRTRFISSTAAAEIRRIYGLKLRVRTADQGSEPDDFWKCINAMPKEGIGPDVDGLSSKQILQEKDILSKSQIFTQNNNITKIKTKKSVKEDFNVTDLGTKELREENSLTTTPPCPQCKKGHLLPYSKLVKVTSRRKEVIKYAAWICSNCNFSPRGNDSDNE